MQLHRSKCKCINEYANDADNDNVNDSDNDSVNVNDIDIDTVNDSVCVYDKPGSTEAAAPSEKPQSKNKHTHKKIKNKSSDYLSLGKFANVKLTEYELSQLKSSFPDSWDRRIEELSSYMAYSGKSYSNYYARLCQWKLYESSSDTEARAPDNTASDASYDLSAYMQKSLDMNYAKLTGE